MRNTDLTIVKFLYFYHRHAMIGESSHVVVKMASKEVHKEVFSSFSNNLVLTSLFVIFYCTVALAGNVSINSALTF